VALSSELQRLQPYIDRAKTFSGWDLGFIRSRSLDGPVPWDYEREAQELAASAATALDTWPELRDYFPRATVFPDHYREYPQSFREMGFDASVERFDYRVAFETLGDLVAMLMVAPWTIPDFDPEADLEALLALESGCGSNEGIVLRDGRYLLRATAP